MSEFDPTRAYWGLCQAVRCTADQWALAALHRDFIDAAAAGIQHEPIEWWHWSDPVPPPPAPAADPPRPPHLFEMEDGRRWLLMVGVIETEFMHKLYDGRLPCWGRPCSVLSDYKPVPPGAVVRIESWWKGGGILRLESGELMYTVRVEKIENNSAVRPASPVDIEQWYREYVQSDGKISERAEMPAAEKQFGHPIPRPTFRDIRHKVLRELRPDLSDEHGQLRSGRRSALLRQKE